MSSVRVCLGTTKEYAESLDPLSDLPDSIDEFVHPEHKYSWLKMVNTASNQFLFGDRKYVTQGVSNHALQASIVPVTSQLQQVNYDRLPSLPEASQLVEAH
jgi:hypothetical protein